MKNIFLTLAVCLAALAAVFSCAETVDEDPVADEQRSLDMWMMLYVNTDPDNPVATKLSNGMYIEYLSRGPELAPVPASGDYVMINYTGKILDGTVFMTRSESVARLMGTYTVYTDYTPQYIVYSSDDGLTYAQLSALPLMRKGDNVRLYVPTWLGMSTQSSLTTSNGYEGEYVYPTGVPVIIDMELVDVVADTEERENKIVADYALDQWSLAPAAATWDNFYFEVTDAPPVGDRTVVKSDSVAMLTYSVYRLDENGSFLVNTNDEAVGSAAGRDVRTYTTVAYQPSLRKTNGSDSNVYPFNIEALQKVFDTGDIFYESEFRMVFTSTYGFGSDGYNSGTAPYTIIQPCTPLVYFVKVHEWVEGAVVATED